MYDTLSHFNIFVRVGNIEKNISAAGLDPDGMEALLGEHAADPKYARRLLYWIYRRGVRSFSEINDMPLKFLSDIAVFLDTGLSDPVSSALSSDGSVKYLFQTGSGMFHEAVYLPDEKRDTVCVSVQAGCRMGCRFCATGLNGWNGNLTAGEIVNQVIRVPHKITNVVMMGMGEPGDNIDEVIRACRILTAEWGLAVGSSRVTVSTVGVVPAVRRLLDETDCNITLSLHSPFPEERRRVIPAEAKWPFIETVKMMQEFSARRQRRFTVAYVMIAGKNDTERHLEELRRLFAGTAIRVNLLPYHPFESDSQVSSDDETMMRFKHLLVTSGTGASVRRSRGRDIAAACGMLAANTVRNKSKENNH